MIFVPCDSFLLQIFKSLVIVHIKLQVKRLLIFLKNIRLEVLDWQVFRERDQIRIKFFIVLFFATWFMNDQIPNFISFISLDSFNYLLLHWLKAHVKNTSGWYLLNVVVWNFITFTIKWHYVLSSTVKVLNRLFCLLNILTFIQKGYCPARNTRRKRELLVNMVSHGFGHKIFINFKFLIVSKILLILHDIRDLIGIIKLTHQRIFFFQIIFSIEITKLDAIPWNTLFSSQLWMEILVMDLLHIDIF